MQRESPTNYRAYAAGTLSAQTKLLSSRFYRVVVQAAGGLLVLVGIGTLVGGNWRAIRGDALGIAGRAQPGVTSGAGLRQPTRTARMAILPRNAK